MTSSSRISELQKLLFTRKHILFVVHRNPDGDALGSAMAMIHALREWLPEHRKQLFTLLSPTSVADFLRWLPGLEDVLLESPEPGEQTFRRLSDVDLIVCVDFNEWSRVEPLHTFLEERAKSVPVLLLDHHEHPSLSAEFRWWDPGASATAELVWRFWEDMDESFLRDRFPISAAICMYTGLLTDTGSFRFNTTTPATHRIAAELLERGVQPDEIYTRIFSSFSFSRMQFFGYAILYRMRYLPLLRTAYMVISAEDLKRFHIQPGETEGLVNYTLALQGTILGALLIDRTPPGASRPVIKISLRSRGTFSVEQMARSFFNGGGHLNAAGGTLYMSLPEAEAYFLKVLQHYVTELAPFSTGID